MLIRAARAFIIVLLCGLAAYVQWPQSHASLKHPDKVLFGSAASIDHERFDVARITLKTLINTYPKISWATRARHLLKDDQRLAKCVPWSVPPDDCRP